ncbi:MAG: hypothetical protein MUF86_01185 [Akkermansiaceae bacterium]|jgi:hypothetical protein|nr:hypothetical protein [Akkermansiaceae bacterium]
MNKTPQLFFLGKVALIFVLVCALQVNAFSEQSGGTKINLPKSACGTEITAALRRVISKPFADPLIFEVNESNFFYYPPLADNHEKNPWHKLLFSGERKNTEFVIFHLGVDNTNWVDAKGKKIDNLEAWIKQMENEAIQRKICAIIFLGPSDQPFAKIKDFLLIYKATSGRYLFMERPSKPR